MLEPHGTGECKDIVEDIIECVFDKPIFDLYDRVDETRMMMKNSIDRPERD